MARILESFIRFSVRGLRQQGGVYPTVAPLTGRTRYGYGYTVQVSIHWQPCRYGGARPYFVCPRCGRRREFLHDVDEAIACRICHGLVHASTRERPQRRLYGRANRLRRQLAEAAGQDPDALRYAETPKRPKGMHHGTYIDIVMKIDDLRDAADAKSTPAWLAKKLADTDTP